MAIRTVVTKGFGNGTFNGTIGLVVTSGYGVGTAVTGPDVVCVHLGLMDALDTVVSTPMDSDDYVISATITGELVVLGYMDTIDTVINAPMDSDDYVISTNMLCED